MDHRFFRRRLTGVRKLAREDRPQNILRRQARPDRAVPVPPGKRERLPLHAPHPARGGGGAATTRWKHESSYLYRLVAVPGIVVITAAECAIESHNGRLLERGSSDGFDLRTPVAASACSSYDNI